MGEFGKLANDRETYVLISSTGEHPDTKYKKNYLDIGKKITDPETGEIQLKVTRFKAPHTSEEYDQITLQTDKQYLNGFNPDAMSRRGWRLSHFVFPERNTDTLSAHQLYDTIFQKHPDAISESDFMHNIYLECFPLVKAYMHLICSDASWKEIVEAHCAIVAKGEVLIEKNKNKQTAYDNYSKIDITKDDWQLNIAMASAGDRGFWGKQEIAGGFGGCGSVKGYGAGNGIESNYITTIIESLSMNNLVKLGIDVLSNDSDEGFLCPNCKKSRVKGNQCKGCGITQQKWAEKTGINCGGASVSKSNEPKVSEEVAQPEKKSRIIERKENVLLVDFSQVNQEKNNNQDEEDQEEIIKKKDAA
jgi:hypothetical protein